MIRLERYSNDKKSMWNNYVTNSCCPSFLFYRDYMDYHADRFEDYSLIIYKNDKMVALLPANNVGDVLYSHQGLTYGGLILPKKYHYEDLKDYLNSINSYLSTKGINTIILKSAPYFYAQNLAQELDLIMLRNHEIETETILGASISCSDFKFPKMSLSKKKLMLYTMEEALDFTTFWEILDANLKERYNAAPVHTLDEIQKLAKTFPEHIKLYLFRNTENQEVEAGTVLFINGNVIKTQYISSTKEGRKNRVSDALYYSVINTFKEKHSFIDFGTCEEENNTINMSLLNAKEKFGANAFPITKYRYNTNKVFTL